MKIPGSKVAIVGAGMVGSATAFALTLRGLCAEIVLIDYNKEKAIGEALDLQHSIEYQSRNVRVSAGDYSDCGDADIVVVTASVPMKGIRSRTEMLEQNIGIMDAVVDGVMASGFNGVFLVVSNPVDVLSWHVWKRSGLPKEQVVGTGTSLETARLKEIIAKLMRIDPRSVQGYAMGEHGDSMMVPWSHLRIAGKPFTDVMEDNPQKFAEVDLDDLVHQAAMAGHEVLRRKGSTQFGIASAVSAIVAAILRDENTVVTVSALLDGQYGEKDVFAGVPAVLGKEGVIDIGEYRLPEQELAAFKRSVAIIRENIASIG